MTASRLRISALKFLSVAVDFPVAKEVYGPEDSAAPGGRYLRWSARALLKKWKQYGDHQAEKVSANKSVPTRGG